MRGEREKAREWTALSAELHDVGGWREGTGEVQRESTAVERERA